MSNPAQNELDLMFSHRDRLSTHPEDADDSDHDSPNEKDTTKAAFPADPNEDTDDDDVGISNRMSALNTAKTTYTVPRAEQYANTGPKGVIADAQSYSRAKRSATRRTLAPIANEVAKPSIRSGEKMRGLRTEDDDEEGEQDDVHEVEDEDEDDEEDDEFIKQWRARKMAELSAQAEARKSLSVRQEHQQQRRVSPSRRAYGSVTTVDATGYLDAVERVSPDTTVVVMLYDAGSTQSVQVEDELDALASRYGHVRFVKMDHVEAEMEHIQIPALIAYRAGEVHATISGAKSDGLERVLLQNRVLD